MDDKAKAARIRELLSEVDTLCAELSVDGWAVTLRMKHHDFASVCKTSTCFETEFYAEKTVKTEL